MKVQFLRRAQGDLTEIRDWLKLENPQAAERVLNHILDDIGGLGRLPKIGPAVRDPRLAVRGFRRLVCEHYLIFYRLRGQRVVVHRVLHARRDWLRLV